MALDGGTRSDRERARAVARRPSAALDAARGRASRRGRGRRAALRGGRGGPALGARSPRDVRAAAPGASEGARGAPDRRHADGTRRPLTRPSPARASAMVIVTLVIGGVLALFGMAEVNPAVGGAPRD